MVLRMVIPRHSRGIEVLLEEFFSLEQSNLKSATLVIYHHPAGPKTEEMAIIKAKRCSALDMKCESVTAFLRA